MTTQQKQAITARIKALIENSSQVKVANKADVSNATISQIVNNKWDLIRDEMWRKIKINLRIDLEWQTADITNTRSVHQLLKASQTRSMSIAVSYFEGTGKSHAYRLYEATHENVIYIECKNSWTKKSFVKHLLTACGLEAHGTIEVLIDRFVNHIKSLHKPLVIFDQIDKVKDPQLDLFMDFYNDLDGACGFVLSGVPAFEKRIDRGCQLDKIGYREIRSRVGRKFIKLDPIKPKDVKAICVANGVDDEQAINEIYNDCDGDLRRVKRGIEQYFLMQQAA